MEPSYTLFLPVLYTPRPITDVRSLRPVHGNPRPFLVPDCHMPPGPLNGPPVPPQHSLRRLTIDARRSMAHLFAQPSATNLLCIVVWCIVQVYSSWLLNTHGAPRQSWRLPGHALSPIPHRAEVHLLTVAHLDPQPPCHSARPAYCLLPTVRLQAHPPQYAAGGTYCWASGSTVYYST